MKFKFLNLLLILIAICLLQITWLRSFGWTPEFVLAGLVSFAFFVNLHELLALGLSTVFLLGSGPRISAEMIVLLMIPVFIFMLLRSSPWNVWAGTPLFTILAVSVFYAFAGVPHDALGSWFFVLNTLASALFALFVVFFLQQVVGYRHERRLFAR